MVLFVAVVLIGTLCGAPDDPETARQKAIAEQTKEAEKAQENATKEAEKAQESATKEAEQVQENATKEAEQAFEEEQKALDEKRKDADLPSCKDLDFDVKRIAENNPRLTGGWKIDDLDKEEIVGVVVSSSTIRITCRAEAKLANDERGWIRYAAEKRGGDTQVRVFPINAWDEPESSQDESSAPVASESEPVGLGISRDTVEDAFGDFDFEDSPLNDGRERLLGDAPRGTVTLQLIGEKDNLEEAALVMTVNTTADNSEVLEYSRLFITTVLPDWHGGMNWFEESVIQLADDSRQDAEVETRHGDTRITLMSNKQFGWLTIKVEPAQGEPQAQVNEPGLTAAVIPPTTLPTATIASEPSQATQAPRRIRRSPVPTPTEGTWEQERLGPRNLLVGALGNGGIVSGKYEYQDAIGDKIVWGDSCFLKINLGTSKQENIQLEKGQPFTFYIQDKHGYVILDGGDEGCAGDSSVGYALLRVGGVGD